MGCVRAAFCYPTAATTSCFVMRQRLRMQQNKAVVW
uniref:Uncharacterized protein n=1 Tax=Arundo donax TaxID=35708 RepID=A0A0A9GBN2_ARUDO